MLRKNNFLVIENEEEDEEEIIIPDGEEEEAMRALLQRFNKKVWTYQELRAVTKLFDSDLTREEKRRMVGRE